MFESSENSAWTSKKFSARRQSKRGGGKVELSLKRMKRTQISLIPALGNAFGSVSFPYTKNRRSVCLFTIDPFLTAEVVTVVYGSYTSYTHVCLATVVEVSPSAVALAVKIFSPTLLFTLTAVTPKGKASYVGKIS